MVMCHYGFQMIISEWGYTIFSRKIMLKRNWSILEENSSEKAYDVGGGGGDREDNDEDDIPNWVGPWDVTSDHIQIDDFTADRLLENDGGLDETLDLRELWNFDLLNI